MANLKANRNIIYEFIRKSIKTQYRNSVLGLLWTILNPLLNMLVMWLVFSQFFGKNDPLYPIYLLTGNILFSCFRSATDMSLTSIVNNRGLLLKTKIDSYIFPLSSTLSSFVTFLFSIIALLIIMLFTQIFGNQSIFSIKMFSVLLMIPAFLLFEIGVSLLLSTLYVFFRDIKYLYNVFLTLLMYMTPIFWKFDILKDGSFAQNLVKANPMLYFVTFFRDSLYLGWQSFPVIDLLILYLISISFFIIGYIFFKLLKDKFIIHL